MYIVPISPRPIQNMFTFFCLPEHLGHYWLAKYIKKTVAISVWFSTFFNLFFLCSTEQKRVWSNLRLSKWWQIFLFLHILSLYRSKKKTFNSNLYFFINLPICEFKGFEWLQWSAKVEHSLRIPLTPSLAGKESFCNLVIHQTALVLATFCTYVLALKGQIYSLRTFFHFFLQWLSCCCC